MLDLQQKPFGGFLLTPVLFSKTVSIGRPNTLSMDFPPSFAVPLPEELFKPRDRGAASDRPSEFRGASASTTAGPSGAKSGGRGDADFWMQWKHGFPKSGAKLPSDLLFEHSKK